MTSSAGWEGGKEGSRGGWRGPREPHRPPPSLPRGPPEPLAPGLRSVRGMPRRGACVLAREGLPDGVAPSPSDSAAPHPGRSPRSTPRYAQSPLTSRALAGWPRPEWPAALRAGRAGRAPSWPSRGEGRSPGSWQAAALGSRGASAAGSGCVALPSSSGACARPRAPLASWPGTVSGAGRPGRFIRRGSRFDPPTSARRHPPGGSRRARGAGAGPCRCHGPAAPAEQRTPQPVQL